MTGSKPDIFHTPLLTPFASRLIHICVDLREIRTSDAHPKIPQNPCGRRDTEACTHLRGQPQNPREGRAACTKPKENLKPHGPVPWGFSHGGSGLSAQPTNGAPAAPRAVGKGGAAKRASPAACGGARDAAPATTQPPAPAAPAGGDMGGMYEAQREPQAPRPMPWGFSSFLSCVSSSADESFPRRGVK